MGLFGDVLGGVGGLVGGLLGGGDRNQANDYLKRAQDAYARLNPYIQPAQENLVTQGPSAYASADPSSRAAQLEALAELQNKYKQGGLTAIDRARLADIQAQAGQTARTAQAGVMDNAARAGTATGGNTLVAQQIAGQQAAQQGGRQAMDAAAQAEQARTGAITGAGSLGTAVRGQDYERANAQDAIARFNAANQQAYNARGADRSQAAQQQTFDNSARQAGGQAGVYGQQAGQKNADAKYTQGMWSGFGDSLGGAADAAVTKWG